MKKIFYLLACVLSSANSSAQLQLAIDIPPPVHSSSPHDLTVFNNKLYMAASGGGGQYQFYSYDGTFAICVYNNITSEVPKVGILNNKLYFSALGNSGYELFVCDGVNPVTMCADIDNSVNGSKPEHIVVIGDTLYFSAFSSTLGRELCKFDGVNYQFVDIDGSATDSDPMEFTEFNNKIYFSAAPAATGRELYVYDPAAGTTSLVGEVEVGSATSKIFGLIVLDNKLYFYATSAAYGRELYSYDGSVITRLTDIAPGPLNGIHSYVYQEKPVIYNGELYFGGDNGSSKGLYVYDPINNLASLAYNPSFSFPAEHGIVFDNKLYFVGDEPGTGRELWAFDGVTAWLVVDFYPGVPGSHFSDFQIFNGDLYFSSFNSGIGSGELYRLMAGSTVVSNVLFNGDVTFVPNPTVADGILKMSLNEARSLQVSVVDMSGRVIHSIPLKKYSAGDSQITIPLSKDATGIYFYQLTDDKNVTIASGKVEKL